ncbi:acyloxyacyl hydrolase [Vibrio sp. RC27]
MRLSTPKILLLTLTGMSSAYSYASELMLGGGLGPQFGTNDWNKTLYLDAILYDHIRSERQILSLGSSITYMGTDSQEGEESLVAFSIFPELKLFKTLAGKEAFFHVRALGPSYLSTKQFGERKQASHFAFQAQVGGGVYLDSQRKYQVRFQYRHFSNANLKQPNDGIDVPFTLAFGFKF